MIDVSVVPFNDNNWPLFTAAVTGRVSKIIDERDANKCFHLELPVTP